MKPLVQGPPSAVGPWGSWHSPCCWFRCGASQRGHSSCPNLGLNHVDTRLKDIRLTFHLLCYFCWCQVPTANAVVPIATPARACEPTAKAAMSKKKPAPKAESKKDKSKKTPKSKARGSKKTHPLPKQKSLKKPAKSQSKKQRREKDEVERKLHSVTKLNPCSWRKVIHAAFKPFCAKDSVSGIFKCTSSCEKGVEAVRGSVQEESIGCTCWVTQLQKESRRQHQAGLFLARISQNLSQSVVPKKFQVGKEELGAQRPPCCYQAVARRPVSADVCSTLYWSVGSCLALWLPVWNVISLKIIGPLVGSAIWCLARVWGSSCVQATVLGGKRHEANLREKWQRNAAQTQGLQGISWVLVRNQLQLDGTMGW